MEEEGDYIDFMAKYKEWISIRRLAVWPDTKPEEISFHMAGISGVIDSKSPSFLGIDVQKLDALAAKITEGKKKGYQALSEVIANLGTKEVKDAISDSCGDKKEIAKLAEACLLGKILKSMGMYPYITQEAMTKIFPDLKIKKPLGRTKKSEA
jgi:hypothetical protein